MDNSKAGAIIRRLVDRHTVTFLWLLLLAVYLFRPNDDTIKSMMLTAFGFVGKAVIDSLTRAHATWAARMKSEGMPVNDHQ